MTDLCTKCNNPPEQVGRGDGCLDPYCPFNKSTTRAGEADSKQWFNEKLNGLFCPVHGAGIPVCNCKTPPK